MVLNDGKCDIDKPKYWLSKTNFLRGFDLCLTYSTNISGIQATLSHWTHVLHSLRPLPTHSNISIFNCSFWCWSSRSLQLFTFSEINPILVQMPPSPNREPKGLCMTRFWLYVLFLDLALVKKSPSKTGWNFSHPVFPWSIIWNK